MNTKSIALVLMLGLIALTVSYAMDSLMGTWKLNEKKSKLTPNTGKNTTVIYSSEGDNIKITVDGVNSDGTARHNEWVGKFDGKEYPVKGDPSSDTRSYTV